MEGTKEKLWTKNFLIVFGVNFLLFLCFYLLMVIIPVYAKEEYGASTGMAGFASSIFVLGALIGRLFGGSVIERIGRKKLLFIGLVAFLVMTALYFFITGLTGLLLVRMLHGIAFAFASTATGTISASLIPKSRHGEGIGYYGVSIIIATAIGPFIGMMITEHATAFINFIICGVFAFITLLSALFVKVPELSLSSDQKKELSQFKLSNFLEVKAIPISAISFVMAFGYSSILSYLTFYAEEIDLVSAASFFFILYAVTVICTRPFTGKWFDQKGHNFVIYPAILFYILGMLLLSQVHSGTMLLLSAVLIGLGYGTIQASAQALAIKVTPSHRIALATSTFYIFVDVGIGIGPFILGFITPYIGFRGMYILMTILLMAGILLYHFWIGRKSTRKEAAANQLDGSAGSL
ncbi:MFS transporter [Cytobacillus gottheilii]|uniref:MFS transporter n=1 Tax=Cytobacillus gottheilii TaxID=859144 RepID=UPI002493FE64|nr:MFS transporter [Cytobacillus gottheilii]